MMILLPVLYIIYNGFLLITSYDADMAHKVRGYLETGQLYIAVLEKKM